MCGFFIEYRKKNTLFNKSRFLTNAEKLSHRGPDDFGTIFLKNFSAKFFRLSILDLSRLGNQPMKSKNDRFVILYNGEIYNYKDLKRKYNLKSKSNSDTEIILLLFEKVGPKVVYELEGMFSIVIFDSLKNKCHFFRDRFGIKPLYYLDLVEKVLLSSEIKPLLNYTKNIVNPQKSLDFFLKQSMDHDQETFLKNIKSVQPSTFGEISSNGFKIKKYWNFDPNKKKDQNLTNNKKKILSLFSSAVNKHLISDRKLGFFFSGGTDSLSIVSEAKKFKKFPKLFTYNFLSKNGVIYGEHEKAKKIAIDLGLDINVTTITPKLIIDNFDSVINACEAPITSIRQICDYLLFKKFKTLNIPVAIIGHGGDELLGGYDYNFLHFLKDKYKKKLNSKKYIEDLIGYLNLKGKTVLQKEELILNYLISLTYQKGSNKDCTPFIEIDNFSKDFLNKHLISSYYNEELDKKYNYLQNSQLKDISSVSLPRNLRYCDRLSMANGIEARVPFLDHKLANFLFNLDNKFKFKNNQTRWIFKSLFQKKTKKYFTSKKNSVPDPQSEWLKSDLKEFFMDEFSSLSFRKSEMFNKKNIFKNLDLFHKNKLKSSFHLFQIFTYQKFKNNFNI
jgi:asparagine synthase (glutamine-hydrolysing)